jgi:hypothetical protein
MPIIMHEKIRIGVSACNAGARVRWNRAGWDRIGAWLAGLPKRFSAATAGEWKSATLHLLRKPSTFIRITSVMQKHWAHYRKHFNPEAGDSKAPVKELSKCKFVEELLSMEKRAVTEGYDFEGAPVLFREKR